MLLGNRSPVCKDLTKGFMSTNWWWQDWWCSSDQNNQIVVHSTVIASCLRLSQSVVSCMFKHYPNTNMILKFTSRTSMLSTRLNSCLRYNHIMAVAASNSATERGPFTSNLPADLGKRTLWKLDLSYLVNGSSRIKKIGCTVSRWWYDAEVIINHAISCNDIFDDG